MPQCPECGNELTEKDYFGPIVGWNDFHNEPAIQRKGGIYRCDNESCSLHTENMFDYDDSEIRIGYPC